MTLRTRLALGSFAIAAVLVIPLAFSLLSLRSLHSDVASFREREFAGVLLLGRVRGTVDELGRAERAFTRSPGDPAAISYDSAAAALDTLRLIAFADLLEAYSLDSAAHHLRLASRAITAVGSPPGARGSSSAAASADRAEVSASLASARRWLNAAERELADAASRVADRAALQSSRSQQITLLALGVAVAAALLIGIWLTVSVSRPVADLERGMLAVAEGKFEHRLVIDPARDDEFGILAKSFGAMAARLDHLEKLKAVWTSVATHELKTPISVIMGHLQLADEGIYGELPPKLQKANETMRRNANVLKSRVQRLLDVSQFEAGAGKLEVTPVEVRKLLASVESSFSVIAGDRRVSFSVSCADDVPAMARWDVERVGEVFDNLLSNAFKFTPAEGTVELRAERNGDFVQLTVRDSGAGIPADQVPRLFVKFYQADNQKRAGGKGTGLGLAITKEIVEAHGGAITCESTVGQGTTFTVTLPIDASPPAGEGITQPAVAAVSSSPSSTSSARDRDSALRL